MQGNQVGVCFIIIITIFSRFEWVQLVRICRWSGIFGSVDSNGFVLGGGGEGERTVQLLGDEAGGVSNGLNVEGGGGGGGGKLPFSVWISGIEFCTGVGRMGLSSKGLNAEMPQEVR